MEDKDSDDRTNRITGLIGMGTSSPKCARSTTTCTGEDDNLTTLSFATKAAAATTTSNPLPCQQQLEDHQVQVSSEGTPLEVAIESKTEYSYDHSAVARASNCNDNDNTTNDINHMSNCATMLDNTTSSEYNYNNEIATKTTHNINDNDDDTTFPNEVEQQQQQQEIDMEGYGIIPTSEDSNCATEQTTCPSLGICNHPKNSITLANNNANFNNINSNTNDNINTSPNINANTNTNSDIIKTPAIKQDQWNQMLGRLINFKKENGHTLVPKRYKDDPKLGTWVETQRVQFRKLWKLSGRTDEELLSLKDHLNSNDSSINDDDNNNNNNNNNSVENQKKKANLNQNQNQNKIDITSLVQPSTRLNKERLVLLQDVGFVWLLRRSASASADTNATDPGKGTSINKSSTGRSPNNHNKRGDKAKVDNTNSTNNTKCLSTAKTNISKKATNKIIGIHIKEPKERMRVTISQKQKKNDAQWSEMYERLCQYRNNFGDSLVPKGFKDDLKLATWVETQRTLYSRYYGKKRNKNSVSNSNIQSMRSVTTTTPTASTAAPNSNTLSEQSRHPNPNYESCTNNTKNISPISTIDNVAVATTSVGTGCENREHQGMPTMAATSTEMDLDSVDQDLTTIISTTPSIKVDAIQNQTDIPLLHSNSLKVENIVQPRLSQERVRKLEELEFVWSLRSKKADEHWKGMYNALLEYKAKYGDCLVPTRFEDNTKLGKWVEMQRCEFKKLLKYKEMEGTSTLNPRNDSKLTPWRLEMLNQVGFQWKVRNKLKGHDEMQWNKMFNTLLQYKERNGNCLVPTNYSPNPYLGAWVHTQRLHYCKLFNFETKLEKSNDENAGKEFREQLKFTPDHKKRLDSIQFCWDIVPIKDVEDTMHEHMAIELEGFDGGGNNANGGGNNANMPFTKSSRVKKSEAGEKRGIVYDSQWEIMFQRLVQYKEKQGDTLVPKRFKVDKQLGTWVDTQRVQYKKRQKSLAMAAKGEVSIRKSRLTDERIKRLEDAGFVWSVRDDWKTHFNELILYKEEHGNCDVPARYTRNKRLGIWVTRQRQQYKQLHRKVDRKRKNPLLPQRVELLNSVGFSWKLRSRETLRECWDDKFHELNEFQATEGHCNVPSVYVDNPSLGFWCETQRNQYHIFVKAKNENSDPSRCCALHEEQIEKLCNIGFDFSTKSQQDIWTKRIEDLRLFKTLHGKNCPVPEYYREDPSLCIFVNTQRAQMKLYKQGKASTLDEHKIAELNSIGISWEHDTEQMKQNSYPSETIMTEEQQQQQANTHIFSNDYTVNHSIEEMKDDNTTSFMLDITYDNGIHTDMDNYGTTSIQPIARDNGDNAEIQTPNSLLLYHGDSNSNSNNGNDISNSDGSIKALCSNITTNHMDMPMIPTVNVEDPNADTTCVDTIVYDDAVTMAADIAAASILDSNTNDAQEDNCPLLKTDGNINYDSTNVNDANNSPSETDPNVDDIIFAI